MGSSLGGLYVGLMSGTSLDAVDAVVFDVSEDGHGRVLGGESLPLQTSLREELLALNTPGHDELARAALASQRLAELYATAVDNVLTSCAVSAADVRAIGAHGQTVRHRPELGYTIQLNAPALLAERCGIDVVSDFRSRDIAAGGQGAPLVPAFHAAQFQASHTRVVLNLGGIANITILDQDAHISGFDTGPANMLMDAWVLRTKGLSFDADGAWAASGQANEALLAHMLADSWFRRQPPKSTGRDDFNMQWLVEKLTDVFGTDPELWPAAQDIQATLLQLTARSVAAAIREYAAGVQEVLVCGGGSRNGALMAALAQHLQCHVAPTDNYGLPSQWVEAAAFAWLAWCHDNRMPAGLPDVTGARQPRVLGCKYPA